MINGRVDEGVRNRERNSQKGLKTGCEFCENRRKERNKPREQGRSRQSGSGKFGIEQIWHFQEA